MPLGMAKSIDPALRKGGVDINSAGNYNLARAS